MNRIESDYHKHLEIIVDEAQVVRYIDLDIDVMGLREALYQIHKQQNGSGKDYSDGESYQRFMLERYQYIECGINEIIESKLAYEKGK